MGDCPPTETNCYHGPFGGNEIKENSKTFSGLTPHTKVTIKLRYWSVDSWDSGEKGYVKVDGDEVWSKTYGTYSSAQGRTQYSGDMYEPWSNDGHKWYEDVEVTLDHTSSSLELLVGTNIAQEATDEYWAFDSVRFSTDGKIPPACVDVNDLRGDVYELQKNVTKAQAHIATNAANIESNSEKVGTN